MRVRDAALGGTEADRSELGAVPALADLIDPPMLQSMMDDFHYLTHIPMALIDLEGTVIVSAGWQDVCMNFHRVHPETCAACIESDTVLTRDIAVGTAQLYQCRNGMWDAATPIVVGDTRIANLFTGQFFFEDEPVDLDFFRKQAARYGFDEPSYLSAIERVPRLSHSAVDIGLRFLKNLSIMISDLSFSRLTNERLYERERRVARLNGALTVIDTSIHGTLDADEMLRRVVVEAAEALECESSALDLREENRWVIRYVYRFPEESIGRAFTDQEVPFAALAVADQAPIVIDDSFSDPRADPEVQRAYNVRSMMVTPLVVHGSVIGLLFFNYHEKPHTFLPEEVTFAQRLSASLGLAIENARLYERQHEIADRLQEALLSVPERVPGIEFAHAYRSAAEVARVGGDFYDLFELDQRQVGLIIGDIAGKGLEAAVLTSMVKNAVRAHANEQGKTPQRILQLANEVVYRATKSDTFATVFFGVLDRLDGRLLYANAGHSAPMVVDADGHATSLGATGPLLGAFPDAHFSEAETRLRLGDTLLLYTDGLTEARAKRELYGEPRVVKVLGRHAGDAPADIVDALVKDASEYAGGQLRDDMAILAVRRV